MGVKVWARTARPLQCRYSMPANGPYLILMTVAAIALLLAMILALKLHAFLALMISSMALGLAAGMPPDKVLKSIQFGFGDALGFIAVVVGLGAMIGRFLEHSGGGRVLADWLLEKFGTERAAWAMLVAAFLVRLADGGRAPDHPYDDCAASCAGRGGATVRRGPRPVDSLRGRGIDPHGDHR